MTLISIHIPKTGGTTFLELLSKHYQEKLLLDYGLSNEDGPEKVKRGVYDCVHGHFLSDKYSAVENAEYVLWLRNPIQKLLSQYNFWKENQYPDSPLWRRFYFEEWTFSEFALYPGFRNEQSKYVGALDISMAKVVGITEFYSESMELFNHELGMHIDTSNVPQYRKSRDLNAGEHQLNDRKLEAKILEYHKKDYELYLKGLEIFKKKYDSISTGLTSKQKRPELKIRASGSPSFSLQSLLKKIAIKWRYGAYYYAERWPINKPNSLLYRGLLSTAWWVAEPLLYASVLYVVFGLGLGQAEGDYAMLLFCGLLFWKWFESSVRNVSASIQCNMGLIYQLYLPKKIIPLTLLTTSTLRFSVVFCLFVVFLFIFWDGATPSVTGWLVDLPILFLVQSLLVAGIGMTLAAISGLVSYIQIIIDKSMLVLFFCSGVFFSIGVVPEPVGGYLKLNPVAVLIDSYRSIILDGQSIHWIGLIPVVGVAVSFFVLGSYLLRKYNRSFAKKAFR